MDVKSNRFRFDQAISGLNKRLRDVLQELPASAKESAFEVRLRVDKPVVIGCEGRGWFVDLKSQLHNRPGPCFTVSASDLTESVMRLCSYSMQSHQHEMKNGFLSLQGGHRAGVCGTAVLDNGKITAIRDITSINLRIARDVEGVAEDLAGALFSGGLCGVLVAGIPSSGKTTILRDLARQLADGRTGRYYKVAVVDERCEIGAVFEGVPQNNLGLGCDILSGYPKGEGIQHAVRVLSPQVIVCDEIGAGEEAGSMIEGIGCGVQMIASAHAGSLEELLRRPQIVRLLEAGAFRRIVLLGDAEQPGVVRDIVDVGELRRETGGFAVNRPVLLDDGDLSGVEFIRQGLPD